MSQDSNNPPPQTDAEWREKLSPEAYHVTREGGTEAPFSHPWESKEAPKGGIYRCVCCDAPLFDGQTKFASGSGWPSFWAPIQPENTQSLVDQSHGMTRTEVRCAKCEAHLGHVFPDGPQPTGERYCINGVALKHDPDASS